MKELKKVRADVVKYAHNPAAMAQVVYTQLKTGEENIDSIELTSPTDPVVYIGEMGIMLAHSTIEAYRNQMPSLYPALSKTHGDLFKHMSDRDSLDVYAQPSTAPFMLLVSKRDLMERAVGEVKGGVRKLIIPRDSKVTVAGYDFTLQYPIVFNVLPYNAVQVVWDVSETSPISGVESVALNFAETIDPSSGLELLRVDVPMMQYNITSYTDTLTANIGWDNDYTVKRQFFCARIWNRINGKWKELKQTLANDVYDHTEVTAVVTVSGKKVNVKIPEVYINSKMIKGEIRIDLYDTVGPLNIDLSNYPHDEFTMTFKDIGGELPAKYHTPISSLQVMQPLAVGGTTGGRHQLGLDELRERVITNAIGSRTKPITPGQLEASSKDLGLEISKPVDFVTERVFNASAPMLASTLKNVSAPIGTAALPLNFTVDSLSALETVKDNGERLTITPNTIYESSGTSLKIRPDLSGKWKSLTTQQIVNIANTTPLYYTPFYYVVDTNSSTIQVRPYHLDDPKIDSKRFLTSNETTGLDVVTDTFTLVRDGVNYKILVKTKSQKPYQELRDDQCFAQLSFSPRGSSGERAFVNAELIGKDGKERIFEFTIATNLDIDRNHELITKSFTQVGDEPSDIPMGLDTTFDLFYGVNEFYPKDYVRNDMDTVIRSPNRDSKGVTQEQLVICFGKQLSGMWAKSRIITSSQNYVRHEEDVPLTYPEDIYATHPKTNVPLYTLTVVDGVPEIEFEYTHRRGESILDDNGLPSILFRKGDPVLDARGNPLIKDPRSILYRVEACVFDAKYLFCTSGEVIYYRNNVRANVVGIINSLIPKVAVNLLEQSKLFYRPKNTSSNIQIRKGDGSTDYIPAENRFGVRYYLSAAQRKNGPLLDSIKRTTRRTLTNILANNTTVSTTDIVDALKNELKSSIISLGMDEMGPNKDINIFSVLSEASRVSIGKKMEILPNGKTSIKDDVMVAFNRHDQHK